MFSLILNIISTNVQYENEIKQMDTDTYDLQEIKKWDILFMFRHFLFLTLNI